ncbi:iron-sulfur cluster assembly protein [Egicoccus sp. AB-alg2]|uniref:metal-sulfur cluster assembly factor n=1 Tax=Egicoccus sp. AB-alg2 TaxID=3242693 RepID=UPI00359EF291
MTQHDVNTAIPTADDDDFIPEADTPSGFAEPEPASGAGGRRASAASETGDPASSQETGDPARDKPRHPFEDLPLEADGMPSTQDLTNGLRAVVDPEIGYNIVDLGLVYDVTKPEPGYAHVLMTLTTMGCPLTEVIHQQCSVILGAMPGVERVEVEFTFTPPWGPHAMADYVREELRAMGMNV